MPWSAATVPCRVPIGTISESKRPSRVATSARRWDSTASWSISARGISQRSAIISALIP